MKRAAFLLAGILLAIPVLLLAFAGTILNTGPMHERVEAATSRAAGHTVRLGRLGVSLVPGPGLVAEDVVVLNAPGFSRAALATAKRVGVRADLMPLLRGRVVLQDVAVDGGDVRLERDAAGRGNWERAAFATTTPGPTGAVAPAEPREVLRGTIGITDTQFEWLGLPVLSVPKLTLTVPDGVAAGTVTANGTVFTVEGSGGRLTATAPDLVLAATRQGEAVAVEARVARLAALSSLAGRPLPALQDLRLSFSWPGPAAIRLAAGASSFGAFRLGEMRAEADGLDAPLRVLAVGQWNALPLSLAASAGTVRGLVGAGPVPVAGTLDADGGRVSVDGTIDPRSGVGGAVISVRVPDVGRAGLLAGQAWPSLHDLAVDARMLPRPGGGILFRGLRAVAREGDLAGDLAVGTVPRPSLRGSLVSSRLDLDALQPRALPGPAPAPAPSPDSVPAPAAPSARTLPFAVLQAADADLQLEAAQVSLAGVPLRSLRARVLLDDGKLRVDPLQAVVPGGPIAGQLTADARTTSAAVTLRAPALDAALIAAAIGQPGAMTGTASIDVAVQGAGADRRSLLATLTGHVSAALGEGDIANGFLLDLFGPALRGAGPLAAAAASDAAGRSKLRCLVLGADARSGLVTIKTLALDSTRLRLEGEGTVNLVDETMAMHLRPTMRVGGTGVTVPIQLVGPMAAPKPAAERGVIAPGRFGLSIGGPVLPDPCPAALEAVGIR